MANSWFRLYAEFEDDPKVRMLSDAMQIRLVYLLCEKCKGVTLSERHRTFQWRCSDDDLAATKRVFMDSGFIDEDWNLVKWNKRQFISDSSTDRTRRYRERVRTSQERHSDASVTPPDTDTEQKNKKPSRKREANTESENKTAIRKKRHDEFKRIIQEYWDSKNKDVQMPWDGREGKHLEMFLRAAPDITADQFRGFLRNRYKSDVNHGERASQWIARVASYAAGPIDRFGKTIRNGNGIHNPGAENQREPDEQESYAMWQGMSEQFKKENPWRAQ